MKRCLNILKRQLSSIAQNNNTARFSSVPPNPPYIPWTPTLELKKKNHYFKRMAFLIQTLEREQVSKQAKEIPNFQVGDVLKLRLTVPENANKEEEFTGVCIARKRKSYRSTFTLRKTWTAELGVERLFHLYSPSIISIEVLRKKKTDGKTNLYHLREDSKATMV